MNEDILWRWLGSVVALIVIMLGLWWFFFRPPLSEATYAQEMR